MAVEERLPEPELPEHLRIENLRATSAEIEDFQKEFDPSGIPIANPDDED